jgi:MFS family permease
MTEVVGDAALQAPVDDRKARRNVLVLATAGALGGAAPPIAFAVAAIAAYDLLGEDKSLATVPITAFVVGTACGTVPAALLMRQIGRRPGFIVGMLISTLGSLFAAAALIQASFTLLSIGTFFVGFAAAFVQQFRFAAADTASPAFRPRAISLVLAGGVIAAIIGPQTVIHTADILRDPPFAGAFLGSSVLTLLAAAVLLFLDIPHVPKRAGAKSGRPLGEIVRKPAFLVAVGCAMSAYAMMSFVMTAAPLAMVMHHHHHDAAVLGIQWHVLAMFVPSFFTGSLIARFGAPKVVAAGLILLLGCSLVALAGSSVAHFWLALVLLGIGWNFGFIGGTALVTETYRPDEKEKVQALNDFIIFGVVALASFSSGQILVVGGWNVLNLVVLPIALACLGALFWQMSRRRALA